MPGTTGSQPGAPVVSEGSPLLESAGPCDVDGSTPLLDSAGSVVIVVAIVVDGSVLPDDVDGSIVVVGAVVLVSVAVPPESSAPQDMSETKIQAGAMNA